MGPAQLQDVKVYFFDVFGTVVDWRSSVENALQAAVDHALGANSKIPSDLSSQAKATDWKAFAQDWRGEYKKFTKAVGNGEIPHSSIESHFRSSLMDLLAAYSLSGLLTANELSELALVWQRLDGWPDSAAGIKALNSLGLETSTLSNGSPALLKKMAEHAGLDWTHITSAEHFESFKPDPRVYRGAVRKVLGEERMGEAAMVAAHLNDLEAAKNQGMRTVYIERRQEEDWDAEKQEQARKDGWVDLWIKMNEGGIGALAKTLG